MRQLPSRPRSASAFRLRPGLTARAAHLIDVPRLLQLVSHAVEVGCREHYTAAERKAVYLSYASNLFVDVLSNMESWLLEEEAVPLAVAQVDPKRGRLRALFVEPLRQGQGLGRLMLGGMEGVARKRGVSELHGAMSMNALGFYHKAGFVAVDAPQVTPMFGVSVKVQTMRKRLP